MVYMRVLRKFRKLLLNILKDFPHSPTRKGLVISKFTPPPQRRRERYIIIYVLKILENVIPNLVKPLQFHVSDRRGRLCSVSHVRLCHTSFKWKGIRLFNSLPMHIRNITARPLQSSRNRQISIYHIFRTAPELQMLTTV